MSVKSSDHLRDIKTYTLLEQCNFFIGKSVGLGNNRDEVDLGVKSAHDLNIEGLERVAGRLDEVDTGVHAVIDNVHAVDLVLGIKISIEPLLNVLHDWSPRVIVVDKVTESRGINHRQT